MGTIKKVIGFIKKFWVFILVSLGFIAGLILRGSSSKDTSTTKTDSDINNIKNNAKDTVAAVVAEVKKSNDTIDAKVNSSDSNDSNLIITGNEVLNDAKNDK